MKPNPTGRTGPWTGCVGRTDDMLIVRGVNLLPTAVRSVIENHLERLTGMFRVRPNSRGVQQDPPLPIQAEVKDDADLNNAELANAIRAETKERLLVISQIELVTQVGVARET